MEIFVCFAFIAGIVAVIVLAAMNSDSAVYSRLSASGLVARGILLEVGPAPVVTSESSTRPNFRRRRIRIDVELPGQPPYELNTSIAFPSNMARAVLPGATVEVRVDPKNRAKLIIVGPGANLSANFFNPSLPAPASTGLTLPPPKR